MDHLKRQLENSLYTGFIDKDHYHSSPFKPELLVNERVKRQDVLTALLDELKICKKFRFAVAFITESGLATLKSTLYDLNQKGIRGEIITSTYQLFNQPKMFKELLKISNVDVKIADVNAFHSKGYIFQHEGYFSLIVGSSNLTAGALKTNYEWNIKLTSHENGEIVQHFFNRFETMWNESIPLTLEWIKAYENVYRPMVRDRVAEFPSMHDFNQVKRELEIKPNDMQRSALDGIDAVRQQGHQRALVVSATGTGKTYLAAFDVRRYEPKRMLFVVHREQILKKAINDFHKVIGGNIEDYGILSGTSRVIDSKYVFATIQTIS
ncbi:MAG: DEAD/DEAH box helicase family protein, partial [Exiguobacterium sp.]|nr:DEAD/DEAH box helicase family protein [Exiguobacterium sp.]